MDEYTPARTTVSTAPIQNELTTVPPIVRDTSGIITSKKSAPAYTVTEIFVRTYAASETRESIQRAFGPNRRSRNSGIVETPEL